MDAHYQEVNTNESYEDVGRKAKVRSVLTQVLICSSIWIQYFMAGLCSGAPTVLIPQMNKEANATIIDDDLSSWIYAGPTISNTPWVIILPLFTKHCGRKIPQTITSIVCVVIFVGMYLSSSPYHLLVAQLIQGYLHSGNLTIAILILTEYSTPKLRGIFLTASAAAFFWGIWIANVIGTFFNWRIITLLGFICSLYTLTTVFLWPESPHWLAGKGRFEECKAAFRRLHGFTAEKELQALITAKEEYIKLEKSEVKQGFFEIIKCPEFYKPMVLALMAVFQYQFTGKMICSVFILDIFKNITASEFMAYMAMLILNGVTVISMYVGSYLSKVLKRRTLYMSSSFIGVSFLLMISLYIYLGKTNVIAENNYILILLLTAYTITISCGPMILSMSIYGELFSTRFQSGSYIIISLVISASYSILYKMTPTIFADLGIHGSFLLYGIICGLCTFYLYVFLPETKNKTQWEIEEHFRGNKRQADPLLYR